VFTAQVERGQAIQVARSFNEVDDTLGDLALILGLVSLAGIGLAGALGYFVSRAAVAPVERLQRAAEQVANTRDLSRRIDASGTDELAALARSFNLMLNALDSSLNAQRQLVADASHELRTPLASLRTNIEVLSRSENIGAEERRALLVDVIDQLEELTELVGDLVELARDAEHEQEPPDVVRLDVLVADAIERRRATAGDVGFDLETEPTPVHAVERRLERAVGNLLDNAVKWSPPGSAIEVRVADGALAVRDHGPGIAEEDLPHIFDRFYRSAAARGLPGSGLGLAIVRQVAETQHGSVAVANADGGGAVFTLRMPVVLPDSYQPFATV
jgi:two-component system sensor histidine kinase MprB